MRPMVMPRQITAKSSGWRWPAITVTRMVRDSGSGTANYPIYRFPIVSQVENRSMCPLGIGGRFDESVGDHAVGWCDHSGLWAG
jgi:hypothetical protein